jgi:uncharacterized protein (DUF1778 family)
VTKKQSTASRRRSTRGLGKKTFAYFTDSERKLVDQAAEIERRSVSSFVANAALTAAEATLRKNSIKK